MLLELITWKGNGVVAGLEGNRFHFRYVESAFEMAFYLIID